MVQRRGKQRDLPDSPDAAHSRPSGSARSDEPDGAIPEMVRRALTLGLSGFFTTEAAVRRALEDTVPKDWTDFIAETSDRTRSEFLERMSVEIGRVLEGVDLAAVIAELMRGRTLEVKAEFKLAEDPDGAGGSPSFRFSTRDTTTPTARPARRSADDVDDQGDD